MSGVFPGGGGWMGKKQERGREKKPGCSSWGMSGKKKNLKQALELKGGESRKTWVGVGPKL